MNSILYKQFEHDAVQWVKEASKILIDQEHSFTITTQKDVLDVATSADIAVEKFLTQKILEKYPDHAIDGEEMGLSHKDTSYVWIIDPLDCTKEYVKGIGQYNILLACEEKGQLVVGIVKRFGHTMVYRSSKGNGAYVENTKLHVSSVSTLDHAFIGTNFPCKKRNSDKEINSYVQLLGKFVKHVYRLRPTPDDARMFSWVAQGAYEGGISIPASNKWFDVAPALLLIEEAGGKVSDWKGNSLKNHDVSKGIVASNGLVHDEILNIVKEAI